MPPPSLAGDLGEALGTMEHADVKFVAGGRPIYAHRVVLSCQSEYFAAMFRFRCEAFARVPDVVPEAGNSISVLLGPSTALRLVMWISPEDILLSEKCLGLYFRFGRCRQY